jgi:hypothetical protein
MNPLQNIVALNRSTIVNGLSVESYSNIAPRVVVDNRKSANFSVRVLKSGAPNDFFSFSSEPLQSDQP